MSKLNTRFPIYTKFLTLYPLEYRKHYEQEILQTTADLLNDAPNSLSKIVVWLNVSIDLPFNIFKQQISYAGGSMHTDTPTYVKRNGIIAGLMLVPFFVALLANGVDKVINNHTLYSSWLWRTPIIGLWVFFLPLMALLLAGTSYLKYLFGNYTNRSFSKRIIDVFHSWPIIISGLVALSIIFVVFFHDTVQCWVQTPNHLVLHLSQTWQCSEQNTVSISKFFHKAI
jgi:hypothetical protein